MPNFTKIGQSAADRVSNMTAVKASTMLDLTGGVFWAFRDFCLSILYPNGLSISVRSSNTCSLSPPPPQSPVTPSVTGGSVSTVCVYDVLALHRSNDTHVQLQLNITMDIFAMLNLYIRSKFFWVRCIHWIFVQVRGSHPLPSESRRSRAVHCNMSGLYILNNGVIYAVQ